MTSSLVRGAQRAKRVVERTLLLREPVRYSHILTDYAGALQCQGRLVLFL